MKQFAFQYATSDGRMLEDTGLITKNEALELWRKYTCIFKDHMQIGGRPEMVIWHGMQHEHDYNYEYKHWKGVDMLLIDGGLWEEAT